MSGQPWTAHNQGERIIFGGPLVTVENASSEATYDQTVPPYQAKVGRKFYKSRVSSILRDNYFSGGAKTYQPTESTLFKGSYWANDKKAVSWTGYAVYVGGKYADLRFGNFATAGYEIVTCGLREPNSIFGSEDDHSTLIIVVRKLVSTDYTYRCYIFSLVHPGTAVQFFPVFKRFFEMGSYSIYTHGNFTKFDKGCARLAMLDSTVTHQNVKLFTVDSSYTSFTNAVIYSKDVVHIHEVTEQASSGNATAWTGTATSSGTLVSGEPRIISIQMESTAVGLLLLNLTAYAASGSSESSGVGIELLDSSSISGSASMSSTEHLLLRELAFDGSYTTWDSGISVSSNLTSSTSLVYDGTTATRGSSSSGVEGYLTSFWFSCKQSKLLVQKKVNSHSETDTGTGTSENSGSWTGARVGSSSRVFTHQMAITSGLTNIATYTHSDSYNVPTVFPTDLATKPEAYYAEQDSVGYLASNRFSIGTDTLANTPKLLVCCWEDSELVSGLGVKHPFSLIYDLKKDEYTLLESRLDLAAGSQYYSQLSVSTLKF